MSSSQRMSTSDGRYWLSLSKQTRKFAYCSLARSLVRSSLARRRDPDVETDERIPTCPSLWSVWFTVLVTIGEDLSAWLAILGFQARWPHRA